MGLLTPLYLVGLVALSLPIAFHLLKKSIRKEMRFSSLIFLRQTPPRLTRRSRVENWWLLILRALILTLLIFAFARPVFDGNANSSRPRNPVPRRPERQHAAGRIMAIGDGSITGFELSRSSPRPPEPARF